MGLWTLDGLLVVNGAGLPIDCAVCPCGGCSNCAGCPAINVLVTLPSGWQANNTAATAPQAMTNVANCDYTLQIESSGATVNVSCAGGCFTIQVTGNFTDDAGSGYATATYSLGGICYHPCLPTGTYELPFLNGSRLGGMPGGDSITVTIS
jgi:hypothetical protein